MSKQLNSNANQANHRSTKCFSLLMALIFLTTGHGCSRSEASETTIETEKKQVVLEKKFIRDPGTGNIKSHTLFVPKGWKLSGQTKWAPKYYSILPSNDLSIASPDGVEARVYQHFSYSDPQPGDALRFQYGFQRPAEGTSDGGYPVRRFPKSVSAWKREITGSFMKEKRPNASNVRIKNVTDFPELTKLLKAMNQGTVKSIEFQNQQARSLGLQMSSSMSIATYVFEMEYTEGGKTFEEILLLGIVETTLNNSGFTQTYWNTCPNISYRAPKGKLVENLPLLMTLTGSVKPTQEWSNLLFNHIAKMSKIDRDAFDERMKLQRQSWAEINRIQNEGRRNQQASSDETHRKVINCIRGTSDYQFDGEEYQLPNGYDHVYTNGYDSIILTNDSLFNPNVDLQGNSNWSSMKKIR